MQRCKSPDQIPPVICIGWHRFSCCVSPAACRLRVGGGAGCGGSVTIVPDVGRSNRWIVPWLGFTVRIGDEQEPSALSTWQLVNVLVDRRYLGGYAVHFLQ